MISTYGARFQCLFSPLGVEDGLKVWLPLRSSCSTQVTFPGNGGSSSPLVYKSQGTVLRKTMICCGKSGKKVRIDDDYELMDEEERLEWKKKIREVMDRSPDVQKEADPEEKRKNAKQVQIDDDDDDDELMDDEERREWRKKIREVMAKCPDVQEEVDPEEKRKKMQKLLTKYPLVVDEDDPDWPEDADGRGFNLDQFFDKITIKNVKKDDDENYDSDKEVVWQDDNYIRPIKDITSAVWEETVFKDISPLIVLVHNRYKRPKENERCRDELEKAVNIIWNCRLPSPRCVAIDAVVDYDLVSALKVSIFPELIFTKSGKILYREKGIRSANELSKIMAFFYYGAAKPSFFDITGNSEEPIPSNPAMTESMQ